MDKSKLLKTNIFNLAKSKVWSVDYAEYQAIAWNEKGILTENDFNELIEQLEALRINEQKVEEIIEENNVQEVQNNNVEE